MTSSYRMQFQSNVPSTAWIDNHKMHDKRAVSRCDFVRINFFVIDAYTTYITELTIKVYVVYVFNDNYLLDQCQLIFKSNWPSRLEPTLRN